MTDKKYFGTDGIRGRVGQSPITPPEIMQLGWAVGQVLTQGQIIKEGNRPAVLIGKDTRISGYLLESALEAGLSASGVDVVLVGPMSTPGVAYLTRALRLQAGIMISASHNPYDDNGIKFFSADGEKLPDLWEHSIEALMGQPMGCFKSAQLGKVRRLDDAAGRYIEFCKSTFPSGMNLRGLKLVVDCAHGAAYNTAPLVFHELGADVVVMGHTPNGININKACGATHPQALVERVISEQADIGIALDGDGDRLIMVDNTGRLYDGDLLLYAIVKHRYTSGGWVGGVIGTMMTNLAVEQAFQEMNIPFERARVGDRYVMEMLLTKSWYWGGENSGHIICRDKHSTGDGIISALQVLAALRDNDSTLGDYLQEVTLYPQVLINVRLDKAHDWSESPEVKQIVKMAELDLADQGRVLLRSSGTEPVVRVMVEGKELNQVSLWSNKIASVIQCVIAKQG
ncbi:MAG: phosphoglucosamine mutase [Ferrovum sp.]|nr:phosphoglucosamine mutase [Ferrovum sp.]